MTQMYICIIGSNAETRRSNVSGIASSIYPNNSNTLSGNHELNNTPDPYLLGRLMGSSYANYPSAFSLTSKGVSSVITAKQGVSEGNKPIRGINAMSATEEPIYVPGEYLVSLLFMILQIAQISG